MLETHWLGVNSKHRVLCADGVEWEIRPGNAVYRNSWPPHQGRKGHADRYFRKLKEAVELRGGKLLSDAFVSSGSPIQVVCSEGHQFESTYAKIVHGDTFCPVCAEIEREDSKLQRLAEIATSHGGALIHGSYGNYQRDKVTFRCKVGHEFSTTPQSVINGNWCPECGKESSRKKRSFGIEVLQKFAEMHGGKCLSTEYTNAKAHYRWECQCGMQFTKRFSDLYAAKSFCDDCAVPIKQDWRKVILKRENSEPVRPRLWMTSAVPLAVELGRMMRIECTSDQNVSSDDPLEWKCGDCGDSFVMSAKQANRQHRRWCASCQSRPKITTEMRETAMATVHGGTVVHGSDGEKSQWTCKVGHKFESTYQSLRLRQHFCLQCAGLEITLETLQNFAAEKGWKLLSSKFRGGGAQHKWQCEHGHEFSASIHEARRDGCSTCARLAKDAEKVHELARTHGGEWVNPEMGYIGIYGEYTFRCACGETFTKPLSNAKRSWNPKCKKCKKKRLAS